MEPSESHSEAKPRIRSLLEIDPWNDIPGAGEGPRPMKVPRLQEPPPGLSEQNGLEVNGQPRVIRSLLDIDPFDSLDPQQERKVPGLKAAPAAPSSSIPSLLDIDPFGIATCTSWSGNVNGSESLKSDSACNQMLRADSEDFNALMNAIRELDCAAVSSLLRTPNLNLNAITQAGERPLTLAAKCNSAAICQDLLSAGANVDQQDALGRSALHYLAEVSPDKQDAALEILVPLLARGANTELREKFGFTPLLTACQSGNQDITAALLPSSDVSAVANDGSSALHLAARKGNLTIVRQLISRNVDVNVKDTAFETPLIIAARAGDAAIVQHLIIDNADLDQKGFMEYTALHWAVHGGFEEVSHQLVTARADLNATSTLMRTPLHRAVTAGHPSIVDMLLQAGSDTERVDANGETALATAVRWGHTEIVQLLLRAHANPNGANSRKPPLIKALCSQFKDIARLLLSMDCELHCLKAKWLEAQDSVQDFLQTHASELPRPLTRLCRSAICSSVSYGAGMETRVQSLPLPLELKEFLLFKDQLTKPSSS